MPHTHTQGYTTNMVTSFVDDILLPFVEAQLRREQTPDTDGRVQGLRGTPPQPKTGTPFGVNSSRGTSSTRSRWM